MLCSEMRGSGTRTICSLWIVLTLVAASATAQTPPDADVEFRYAVLSLHDGNYAEAIVRSQQALAAGADIEITRRILARAYLAAGFTEAALGEFSRLEEQGALTTSDQTIRDAVTRRIAETQAPDDRLVRVDTVPDTQGELILFANPSSLVALPNGDTLVVSYDQHAIHQINANGVLKRSFYGGIAGFDGPFDILPLENGGFIVSEFNADRIAVLDSTGTVVSRFGESGAAPGQLLGPQYLAVDGTRAVYVTEWATQRISAFALDGRFLFQFGEPRGAFPGFGRPTGIVIREGDLFVADSAASVVYRFDMSGNYLGRYGERGAYPLTEPEALRIDEDGGLLIGSAQGVLHLNIETDTVQPMFVTGEAISAAVRDANGRIITAHFDGGEVAVLEHLSDQIGGLVVRIDRIRTDDFPRITLAATVESRDGRPLVGLLPGNFTVVEGGAPLEAIEVSRPDRADRARVALIVDTGSGPGLADAIALLKRSVAVDVIGAAATPQVLATSEIGPLSAGISAAAFVAGRAGPRALDRAIRFAVTSLLDAAGPRSIVLFADEPIPDNAFDQIGLIETLDYLRAHHIPLSVISTAPGGADPLLAFLAEETGGTVGSVYDSDTIRRLAQLVTFHPEGRYQIAYRSQLDSDFGRRMLETAVEVRFVNRSGRDALPYFAPTVY